MSREYVIRQLLEGNARYRHVRGWVVRRVKGDGTSPHSIVLTR